MQQPAGVGPPAVAGGPAHTLEAFVDPVDVAVAVGLVVAADPVAVDAVARHGELRLGQSPATTSSTRSRLSGLETTRTPG